MRLEIPADLPDADVIGLVLLATLVLCFIAMTSVLTIWTSRLLRQGRRSRPATTTRCACAA